MAIFKRDITITTALSVVAALAGLLVASSTFISGIWNQYSRIELERRVVGRDVATKEILELAEKLKAVENEVKGVEQRIQSISAIPKEDALNIEIQNIKASTTELAAKQAKIESAILESPSKALEIPLLRRDLDSVRELQQSGLTAIKESVDRIYDLNKWLLGAMAVSVVSLALGNLLKPRDAKPSSGQD